MRQFWREAWREADSTERLRLVTTLVLTVAVVSLFLALVSLKNELHTIRQDQLANQNQRNTYQVDERGIECEITHKLMIYTPSCNDPSLAPDGGVPTTTTTTTP